MITDLIVRIVEFCRAKAPAVLAVALLVTIGLGWFTATHLAMNTNTDDLIASDTPWRKRERAFDAAFPQMSDRTVIVIDGATADLADDAAQALADKLAADKSLFRTVYRPDGIQFFRQYGLLFLSTDELQKVADQLIEAQPLLGTLNADPSLRGVFGTLNLALEGVERGVIKLSGFERPIAAFADSIESVVKGQPKPVSWQTMLTGRTPGPLELRRFILVQAVLDYNALQPGEKSSDAIRAAARELNLTPENGVRVRLTGSVPLSDDEFATVAEGTGLATVASIVLVSVILFLALRSGRLIFAVLLTLVSGLIATGAFAAATVGALNMISVAFAVLFVGIAVDFGIQFCMRYRDERHRHDSLPGALRRTASTIGASLALAALSTSLGFLSFLPTEYAGISELGIIAGGGMVIALIITLTVLPALIAVLHPPGEPEPIGFARAAAVDAFLLHRRKAVIAVACVVAVGCAALLPSLRFDFNPLNLKDPDTESAATMFELIADPNTSPFTADVLAPTLIDAQALGARMKALPEVERTLTLASFVPEDQDKKLPIIEDLNMLLGPTLSLPPVGAPPTDEEIRAVMTDCANRLERLANGGTDATRRLAASLRTLLAQNPLPIPALNKALLSGLDRRVNALREALQAGPVTLETIPDDLRRNWITKDGQARLEIAPKGDVRDNDVIRRFARATLAVSPEVTGSPITILESGNTVVSAFKVAGLAALVTITLLLAFVLRRLRDILLVLAPLVLAGLLTAGTMVVFHMPLNFANIIALPLLLGIGVAFDIYFVTNWRAGRGQPLQSSLARAILYSGLTTGVAFGSLALSTHPGTSSMGVLLAVMLAYALFCTLLVLPALLGPPPKDVPAPRKSGLD